MKMNKVLIIFSILLTSMFANQLVVSIKDVNYNENEYENFVKTVNQGFMVYFANLLPTP